jgi:hypothetical protein
MTKIVAILLLLAGATHALAINIKETEESYIVADIEPKVVADGKAQAEDLLLNESKNIAFDAIKEKLGIDIELTSSEIDTLMVAFSPREVRSSGDGYNGLFDVVFDKEAIDAVIRNKKINEAIAKDGNMVVFARITTDGRINNWVDVCARLKKTTIEFSIVGIKTEFVDIAIKGISDADAAMMLSAASLKMVKNGNMNFIKIPLFS